MAVALPPELEDETFAIQGDAMALLEGGKIEEAVEKIWTAWHKLPEPKFNTSCSYVILTDLVEILNAASKHEEAEAILIGWINDVETCGYKIIETKPFILLGETYLYVGQVDKSKEQFYKAVKYGASKRDFSGKPQLYFDIAKKKITDDDQIISLFSELIAADYDLGEQELPEDISDKINEAAEHGNELIEEEKFAEAIEVWKKALALIPEPQNTFPETLWFEVSIGDTYFLQGDFETALRHFETAKGNIADNGYENPLIMLRLGQLYYEAQRPEEAKEYLLRAYMMEGEGIFESDDARYFEFLKTNVDLE